MIIKLMHLLEKLTGVMLGAVGIGVQVGTVLICLFMILLGPAFIIDVFPK